MKHLWRFLFFLLSLTVIISGGVALVLHLYINTDDFRDDVALTLSRELRREVLIKGDFNVSFYPRLGLTVHDLSIADAAVFGSEPIFSIKTVSFILDDSALLERKLKARFVEIDGLNASLVRSESGETNWHTLVHGMLGDDSSAEAGTASIPFVDLDTAFVTSVLVQHAELNFTDHQAGQKFSLKDINLRTGPFSLNRAVAFTFGGAFQLNKPQLDSTFTLTGLADLSLPKDESFLTDAIIRFDATSPLLGSDDDLLEFTTRLEVSSDFSSLHLSEAKVQLGQIAIAIEGMIESLDSAPRFKGRLVSESFEVAELYRLSGQKDLPASLARQKGKASITVDADMNRLLVDELAFSFGKAGLTGEFQLKNYKSPHVTFQIDFAGFDLDVLLAGGARMDNDSPQHVEPSYLWNAVPFNDLMSFEINGNANFRNTVFKQQRYVHVPVAISLSQGSLGLEAVVPDIIGGKAAIALKAVVKMDETKKMPVLSSAFDIELKGMAFDSLGALDDSGTQLRGNGDVTLKGSLLPTICKADVPIEDALEHIRFDLAATSPSLTVLEKNETGALQKLATVDDVSMALKDARFVRKGSIVSLRAGTSASAAMQADDVHMKLAVDGPAVFHPADKRLIMNGAKTIFELNGPFFENGEPLLVMTNASVDTVAETLKLDDLRATLTGTLLTGHFEGKDILKDSYRLDGHLNISDADFRRFLSTFGNDDVEMRGAYALRHVDLDADVTVTGTSAELTNVTGMFDETSLQGWITLTQLYRNPMIKFALEGDRMDLNGYRPPEEEVNDIGEPDTPAQRRPMRIPLRSLRYLRLDGSIELDTLEFLGLELTDLKATAFADQGLLVLKEAKSGFYEGELSVEWSGKVLETMLDTSLIMDWSNFQLAPFFEDIAERDYLRGEASLKTELTGQGATDQGILETLQGQLNFEVGKGSYKFSDTKPTQEIDPDTGKPLPVREKRTSFSKAFLGTTIREGKMKVETYQLESPVIKQTAKGYLDLPQKKINVAIRNDFIGIPSVTVTLKGNLLDPEVGVPSEKILDNTVKNILGIPERTFRFFRDLFF